MSYVEPDESVPPQPNRDLHVPVAQQQGLAITAVQEQQSAMMGMLEKITKRLEKLETGNQATEGT